MTIENPSPAAPLTPLLVQLGELHTRILNQAREYDWAQVQTHLPLAVDWPGEVRRAHNHPSGWWDGDIRSLVIAAALHRSPAIVRDWLLELARERGAWYRDRTETRWRAVETAVATFTGLPSRGHGLIMVDAMRRAQRLWALLDGPTTDHARWLEMRFTCEVSALEAERAVLASDAYHLVDAEHSAIVAASSVATALGALARGAAPRNVIRDAVDACYQLAWLPYNIELASAPPGQVVPDSLLRAAVARERAQVVRLAEMLGAAEASS